MTYSSDQLQLLSLLNIEPLILHSHFNISLENQSAETFLQPPKSEHPLVQDIYLLLQSTDKIEQWQLDMTVTQSRLDNALLYTPDLQQLQQPAVKKQLWQLLQQVIE